MEGLLKPLKIIFPIYLCDNLFNGFLMVLNLYNKYKVAQFARENTLFARVLMTTL